MADNEQKFGRPSLASFQQDDPQERNLPIPHGRAGEITMHTEIFTAQRVAVARDVGRVMQNLRALAAAAGTDNYVYRIPFKNRKTGTIEYVEGPTIGLALDLAREWGNTQVDCRLADETPTHWNFEARFVDLERGFVLRRPFQQRKFQDTGMKDQARSADIVFQIGASKAIRNVIVNALKSMAEMLVTTAKEDLLQRIERKPDQARAFIATELGKLGVDIARVERVVGRPHAKWLVPEMAKVFAEITSVNDGMIDPEDVWPLAAEQAEANRTAAEKEAADAAKAKQPAKETENPAPAAEPAAKAQPKPAAGGGPAQNEAVGPERASAPVPAAAAKRGRPPKKEPAPAAAPQESTVTQQQPQPQTPAPAAPATRPAAPAPTREPEDEQDQDDDIGNLRFT